MFIASRWSGGRCNLVPSVCLRGPFTGPQMGLSAWYLPRSLSFAGQQKGPLLPPKIKLEEASGHSPEAQSPLAWQLCFPRANLTGVLKPRPAGKEEAGEQRCFLRHAGYMEGKGQAPFLSLALWVQNVALSSVP